MGDGKVVTGFAKYYLLFSMQSSEYYICSSSIDNIDEHHGDKVTFFSKETIRNFKQTNLHENEHKRTYRFLSHYLVMNV